MRKVDSGATRKDGQHDLAEHCGLVISKASREDCMAIARIYAEAIDAGSSTMDTSPLSAAYFEHILDHGRNEALLVGRTGTDVQAWGIVKCYSDRPGYRFAAETSVYVANDTQGRGFGSSMLAEIIEQARELGYRHLVAKILAINESSVRFHQRFGFTVVGRQQAIGFLNGRWHDIVIMQRILEGPCSHVERREERS